MLVYVLSPYSRDLLRHTVDATSVGCDSSKVYLDYLSL